MADNTTLSSGSGGDTLRTEDRTTYKTPVSLIDVGGTSAESILGDAGVTLPSNLRSEQVDDAAFTPATSRVLMVGAEFDDTTPDSVDEGDGGAVRMSARRELYTQIRDAAGNERGVNVNASNQLAITGPVTNAGTFAVQVDGAALTALQLLDDAVYAEDVAAQAADKGVAILAVRRDADTSLVGTDNDYANLQVDANGYLKVEIFDGGGSHTVDNAGTFAVQVDAALPAGTNAIGKLAANSGVDIGDVDVTSVIPGTGATNLGKAEDAAHSSGDVGVAAMTVRQDTAAALAGTDADYQPLITDASGRLHVNVGNTVTVGSHAVTNAGTFAVQVDGAALTSLQLIDDTVYTDDAAFTPGTSKVLAIGAQADETAADSVDEGDVGALRMTLDRVLRVLTEFESNSIRAGGTSCTPKYAVIDAATSGDNTLVAAVASKKIRVLAAFLGAAGTVNVRFESGAGGTALTGQMNLVANVGFVLPLNELGWFETASNTLLNLELSAAISVDGALVYIEV